MNTYYQIEYWNSLFKKWVRHDFKKYKTLQSAKYKVSCYKEHKLGIKLRIIKLEIIYEDT